MADQVLKTISKDEKERMLYESQLLYEADQEAEWRYRERKAVEAGILTVAKSLKQDNLPLDVISKNTGISLEILKSL